jgi:hypothetical protein
MRVCVGFSDGQVLDSAADMTAVVTPGMPVLMYSGGVSALSGTPALRSESRWWVSPLPPAGPVQFTVLLPGSPESAGAASIDAARITSAAERSEVLWPEVGAG